MTNKLISSTKKNRNKVGGEVIGAGGFGCVFEPALRCNNTNLRSKGISKLSSKGDSIIEWQRLELAETVIRLIPNYQNYFLINDITKCQPNELSSNDKKGFDKCSFLTKEFNITEKNINNNLQNLDIINMPYGGKSLNDIIMYNTISIEHINTLLINLLINGIIPMNNLRLFHFDIKADNLLYKDNYIRVIDFGEIGLSTSNQIIPTNLYNRGIQFNSPFSRILFSNKFDLQLDTFLKNNNLDQNSPMLFNKLQAFILEYYNYYKTYVGEGHVLYLSLYILKDIFKLNNHQVPEANLLDNLISIYCAKILMKYVDFKTRKFDKNSYFLEVYSKNVDVYGLIMGYVPFIVRQIGIDKKEPTIF